MDTGPGFDLTLASLTWPTLLPLILGVAALIALALALCWARARKQYRTVLSLTGLSQQVLQTGLVPEDVHRVIAAHVHRLAREAALVVYLEPESGPPQPIVVLPEGRVASDAERQRVGQSAYQWLKEHRRPLVVPDLNRSPVEPLHLDRPARSAVYVPLIAGGRFLGAFALQCSRRRAFRGRAQTSLAVCAEQIALGLDAARLYRREQERSAQLLLIAEVSRKVAAILDLDTLFADTVRLVQEILGYYHVSIFSLDREKGIIELQASSSPLIQERGITLAWGTGLIGHAAQGEVILANDVRQDPRFLSHAALDQTAAELSLPLMVEDRVLGVLDLQSDQCDRFDEDEISILRILADQIAVAIEDSHIYRAQQEQSWVSTALLQVAEALASETTLEQVSASVARLTRLFLGVQHCAVLSYSAETNEFCLPLGDDGDDSDACPIRYPSDQIPLLQRVWPARTALAESAEALGPLARLWEPEPGTDGRVYAYPLAPRGRLLGVLLTQTGEQSELAAPQRAVLEGIANQAAMALDSAALLAAQREEAWISTALLQVATVIAGASYDVRETVTTVVRLVPMLVGVSWCAVLIREANEGRYAAMASYGLSPDLQELSPQPTLTSEDVPWLEEMQRAQEATLLSPPSACDALSFCQFQGQDSDTLVLPLRAHHRELGLLLVGPQPGAPAMSGRRLTLLNGIASQTSLAIAAARLYEQSVRQERMEHEMRLARDIQASFLPEACPEIPGWRIAVDWRAASGVGGDYYDLVQLAPRQLTVTIADVSDKGVAAALYMALSRTVLRAAALDAHGPAETLQRANRVLLEDSRSGMFVTLVYGNLDLESGVLRFVRAGHNPPLLVRARDRRVTVLEPNGIVLGVVADPVLEEATIEMAPGDVLVLYTDGVTEAWNEGEEEFGLERLQAVVRESDGLAPEPLIARINEAVRRFVGDLPQADDYTLLVIQREPEA
jgi:phosphoserine phosphatase RsbU/P